MTVLITVRFLYQLLSFTILHFSEIRDIIEKTLAEKREKERSMHIWLAINLDDQLSEIREKAAKIEHSIAPEVSAFTLPMHVSLKISFFVPDEDYNKAKSIIFEYYKTISPFDIEIDGIEKNNSIVWISMKENESLCRIHRDLDKLMADNLGITPHPFDLDFKFHSTLFIDADEKKSNSAYFALKDLQIPKTLRAKSLIIGSSETGKMGTYKVTDIIEI